MSLEFDFSFERDEFQLNLKGEFNKPVTGLVGRSGVGKTTFFNLITGRLNPNDGYINLNNRTLYNRNRKVSLATHRRRVGVVFQENLLFPHLSIKKNILFGKPYFKDFGLDFDQIIEVLQLETLLDSYPHMLSGGEQQRVAIARSLITNPDLLLMDEPFNALDYSLRDNILMYIKDITNEFKIQTLIISHDIQDLESLTPDIYQLKSSGLKYLKRLTQNSIKVI